MYRRCIKDTQKMHEGHRKERIKKNAGGWQKTEDDLKDNAKGAGF